MRLLCIRECRAILIHQKPLLLNLLQGFNKWNLYFIYSEGCEFKPVLTSQLLNGAALHLRMISQISSFEINWNFVKVKGFLIDCFCIHHKDEDLWNIFTFSAYTQQALILHKTCFKLIIFGPLISSCHSAILISAARGWHHTCCESHSHSRLNYIQESGCAVYPLC